MPRDGEREIEAIGEILWRDWDPIGVNAHPEARGEYDGYIGGIRRLLDAGADKVKIVRHLRQIETVGMGLSDRGDEDRERVAEILLRLSPKRKC
jgi:hypothetical protein